MLVQSNESMELSFRKPVTAVFSFQVYFYGLTFVYLLKLFFPNADWLMRRLLIFSIFVLQCDWL
jgi:hypothetical protein